MTGFKAPDAFSAEHQKRLVETIEQQASEMNSFATRLDAAYKELESTNARLTENAFKDDATELYNRRLDHPVSVVLIDLDGSQAVKDGLGRAIAEDTLRDVAQILMKDARSINVMNVVARYDADLFGVVLVEIPKAAARLYANRIREMVAKYPFSQGCRLAGQRGDYCRRTVLRRGSGPSSQRTPSMKWRFPSLAAGSTAPNSRAP